MARIKISPKAIVILPQFRKTMLGSLLPKDVVEKLYTKFGKPKEVSKTVQERDVKGHFQPTKQILKY